MRYTGLVTAEVEEFFHVLWHSMLINEFLPGFCQWGFQLLTIANKYVISLSFFFAMILRVVSGHGLMFIFFPLTFLPQKEAKLQLICSVILTQAGICYYEEGVMETEIN